MESFQLASPLFASRWKSLALRQGLTPLICSISRATGRKGFQKSGSTTACVWETPGLEGSRWGLRCERLVFDFQGLAAVRFGVLISPCSRAALRVRNCEALEVALSCSHRRGDAVAWASHLGRIIQAMAWGRRTLSLERSGEFGVGGRLGWRWRFAWSGLQVRLSGIWRARLYLGWAWGASCDVTGVLGEILARFRN